MLYQLVSLSEMFFCTSQSNGNVVDGLYFTFYTDFSLLKLFGKSFRNFGNLDWKFKNLKCIQQIIHQVSKSRFCLHIRRSDSLSLGFYLIYT